MTKHHRDLTAAQVTCGRIAERVAKLVEPFTEHVSQVVPAADGGRTVKITTIEHPSLLAQLADPTTSAGTEGASGAPSSKAPINLGPLAVLHDIETEARTWVEALDPSWSHRGVLSQLVSLVDRSPAPPMRALGAELASLVQRIEATTEERMRHLVERAPLLSEEQLWNLDREVTRWWANARVATTWGDPPHKMHVPCPECSAVGKIRVQLDPTAAVCIECGTAWDALTITDLGTAVQILAAATDAERAARVIERRPCSTCGQEHAPGHYPTDEVLAAHTAAAPAELHGRTTTDIVPTTTGGAA